MPLVPTEKLTGDDAPIQRCRIERGMSRLKEFKTRTSKGDSRCASRSTSPSAAVVRCWRVCSRRRSVSAGRGRISQIGQKMDDEARIHQPLVSLPKWMGCLRPKTCWLSHRPAAEADVYGDSYPVTPARRRLAGVKVMTMGRPTKAECLSGPSPRSDDQELEQTAVSGATRRPRGSQSAGARDHHQGQAIYHLVTGLHRARRAAGRW